MAATVKARRTPGEIVRSYIPILTWLPQYDRGLLRTDLMAGLAVWAMTVPQALAYASIAGIPPVYALYTVPFAMILYAIFGTSRTLCVGPESAIAIVSAVTVGALAAGDPVRFLALTSLLALIVGVLFLVFGFFKLGWVASFLGQPVLKGFTMGIALTVMIGQFPTIFGTKPAFATSLDALRNIPELLGLSIGYEGFFVQTWAVIKTVGQAHAATALIGIASLVLLFVFRRVRPLWPSSLVAVALAVIAVSVLHLDGGGVSVIGEVPTGMVSLALPELSLSKIMSLLPGALAIVLLGYAVSLGVAKVGAQETKEEIDPDQELVAHGFANVGAALSSGMVVCGSLSRGSVIRGAGGKTQIVSLVNGVLVILTLTFALPLFYKLPLATLAAIVVVAMYGILDVPYMKRLFRFNRAEFAVSMVALFGVLVFGILAGVTIGVVLALAVLVRRVCRPSSAVLGRIPGTSDFRDVSAHPEAETVPGLLIFRFDAPVIFVNASYFADSLRRLVADAEEAGTTVREVLIPAQQINDFDSSAADQLKMVLGEFESRGVALSFAEAKLKLREAIRRIGLDEKIGADRFYDSIDEAVRAFAGRQK